MHDNIRNFVIIAHIDHGKSTLADRFLETTGTIETRKMHAQYLDQLDLEQERGITIKMAPVRMTWKSSRIRADQNAQVEYVFNLIDTPGHSDFSYEVSRSLAAVEGAILLVDATQGIQAQTLANFRAAQAMGLTIIGAINKIDLFPERENDPRVQTAQQELAELLHCDIKDISFVSGKSGEGVEALLDVVIERIPPPRSFATRSACEGRALIFDSFYDDHKGVIASVRVVEGSILTSPHAHLIATDTNLGIKEIGYFMPKLKPKDGALLEGEIGYVATGVRDTSKIKIGDTVLILPNGHSSLNLNSLILPGYKEPRPVVFVSFYPEENDEFELLEKGLQKLRLNDSALSIEPDQNEVLGRGFKVGFLGRLHFEITSERLKREFAIRTVNTFPSVCYKLHTKDGWSEIVRPEEMPQDYIELLEPMIAIEILVPSTSLSPVLALQKIFRMENVETHSVGDRVRVTAIMPLVELVSDFDDNLKSATKGFASFSYELHDYVHTDAVRVDILVAGDIIPGLSRFIPKASLEREARTMVERLKILLPRQQFAQSIQASAGGSIIARDDVSALKKDVTGYLYGGDRTRKMKLWKKQQRGKKRLKSRAEGKISPEVFKELLKK